MSDERVWNLSFGLLNDPSLDVRAVVAESVVRHSQQEEQKSQALNVLLEIPLQKEAPWGARMIALNALCDLEISDQQAARIQDAFERDGKSWSRSLPDRYSEYLKRLVSRLVQADDAQ